MTKNEAKYRLKNMAWLYGSVEREQNLEAIDMAIEALKSRPTGRWIDSKTAKGYVVCSSCNKLTASTNRKKYNYCPFCGADVRSGVI